jgi:hypothetical protein
MPKRLLPERDPMRPEVSLALLLSSRIQHVMRRAQGALGLLGRAEPLNVVLLRPAPGGLPGQHNRHGVSIRPRAAYSTNRTDMPARSRQTNTRFRFGRKRPTQPTGQTCPPGQDRPTHGFDTAASGLLNQHGKRPTQPTRQAAYSTNTASGLLNQHGGRVIHPDKRASCSPGFQPVREFGGHGSWPSRRIDRSRRYQLELPRARCLVDLPAVVVEEQVMSAAEEDAL